MSDDEQEYGLVKSFDIDNGELDGLSPQQCFTLGYELATIDYILKINWFFTGPVHSKNKERIEKACRKSGREFKLTWMHNDTAEEWMYLELPKPDPTRPIATHPEEDS